MKGPPIRLARGPRACILTLAILAAACGEGQQDETRASTFQLRPVMGVLTASSSQWDTTALTCDAMGPEASHCLAARRSGPVVVLGPADTDKYVLGPVVVDGADVAEAAAREEPSAGWSVIVKLTPEGSDVFAAATRTAVGDRIAIVVDGRVVSAPTVQAPISSGDLVVTGDLSEAEAKALADRLGG